MKKRHTMLCRLADETSEISYACQRQMQSLMSRVCCICIPVVCLRAIDAFTAHLRVISIKFVGITLFVSKQGLRGPHQQMSRRWIPTFFVVWIINITKSLNLGIIGINNNGMAREILTMTKRDVQVAISEHLIKNYKSMNIIGRDKPDSIQTVLATIQDKDYKGAGKYNVHLDVYGNIKDEYGNWKENINYTTLCSVHIQPDSENSPLIKFLEPLCFTEQIH